jgi:hypothetical protein
MAELFLYAVFQVTVADAETHRRGDVMSMMAITMEFTNYRTRVTSMAARLISLSKVKVTLLKPDDQPVCTLTAARSH